jgi:hypothetical protein
LEEKSNFLSEIIWAKSGELEVEALLGVTGIELAVSSFQLRRERGSCWSLLVCAARVTLVTRVGVGNHG